MKKIIFVLIMMMSFVFLYSQKTIGHYYSSFFQKTYDIQASYDNDGLAYYIEGESRDNVSKQIFLMIQENKISNFMDFLNYLKDTYVKWSNTANENNVTDLDKQIEYKDLYFGVCFSYGDWQFNFNTYVYARFKITKGEKLMIIQCDKVESGANEYITTNGFYITFSSVKEIDDLIKSINPTKDKGVFIQEKNKETLFK
jgi:hypothetical protein